MKTFLVFNFLFCATVSAQTYHNSNLSTVGVFTATQGLTTVDAFSITKTVNNQCPYAALIPTKSQAEYSRFIANKPPCISFVVAAPPPPPPPALPNPALTLASCTTGGGLAGYFVPLNNVMPTIAPYPNLVAAANAPPSGLGNYGMFFGTLISFKPNPPGWCISTGQWN